jgi:hypothetical protein
MALSFFDWARPKMAGWPKPIGTPMGPTNSSAFSLQFEGQFPAGFKISSSLAYLPNFWLKS